MACRFPSAHLPASTSTSVQDRAWHAALAAVFEIRAGASNTEPTAPARMLRIGPVLILGVVTR